jgi:hypothetical protein
MKTEKIKVSYRDKTTNTNVSLGEIDTPRFDNVQEAIAYFDEKEGDGKGEETVLEYVHTAYDIELQRRHRDAHRPDKPKSTSNVSVFRQLSQDKQEELLKQARELGLIS